MKQWPLSIALVLSIAFMINASVYADDEEDPLVRQGFAISPVPKARLKFREENRERVGLGSFIVNAIGACGGCHSFPQYLEKATPPGAIRRPAIPSRAPCRRNQRDSSHWSRISISRTISRAGGASARSWHAT
jgi:hypothetical protein